MTEFLDHLQVDEKKSIISLLIKMSEADNSYDEKEISIIKNMGVSFGFSVEEIKEIKHNPESFQFMLPKQIKDRVMVFYNMLYIMKVDDKIDKGEINLINLIGKALELKEELINDLVLTVRNYNGTSVLDEALLNQVKKHLK